MFGIKIPKDHIASKELKQYQEYLLKCKYFQYPKRQNWGFNQNYTTLTVSDKIDFTAKNIPIDKEHPFLMIKEVYSLSGHNSRKCLFT